MTHISDRSHHAADILKRIFHSNKRIKYFTFTLRRENLKTQQQSPVNLDLCLGKTRAGPEIT